MRLPQLKFLVIALLLTVASMFMTHGSARAYYGGGLYGGAGLYGLGGGLYGGLYGSGGYGGLYGGGYGGLYGGIYGGLYGGGYGGLYGGYGLGGGLYGGYGLGGGLYGGYGLGGGLYGGYGLGGGLYGSGLYGGLGLYGLGGMGSYGLYGLGGLGTDPYGLGRYYLGNGSEALGRASDVLLTGGGTSLLSLLPTTTTVAPALTVTVPIYPDPTGVWLGSWTSLSSGTGPMNMNLTYTILNVSVTGTAGLILNKLIPISINVGGLNNSPSFLLTGTYINPLVLVSYSLTLNCAFSPATLTLPAIIQGTYLIHDPLYLKTDSGTFSVGRL